MDAIQLMLGLFLNAMLACSALPAEDRDLPTVASPLYAQHRTASLPKTVYQVLPYQCGDKHFEVWSRSCQEVQSSERYFTRSFLLVERRENVGFYLNQFGELHASTTGTLQLNDLYVPQCGS
jgi:hypothetical protein